MHGRGASRGALASCVMRALDVACVVRRRRVRGGFGASIDCIKRTHRATAAAAAAVTHTGCPAPF